MTQEGNGPEDCIYPVPVKNKEHSIFLFAVQTTHKRDTCEFFLKEQWKHQIHLPSTKHTKTYAETFLITNVIGNNLRQTLLF